MKKLSVVLLALFATLILAACQGSSNSNPGSVATCSQQTVSYNQYGQAVPGCVSPSTVNNPYLNNPYLTGTNAYSTYGAYGTSGYSGYGSNPCSVYYYQYGVMYYPAMVGGSMQCVASQ